MFDIPVVLILFSFIGSIFPDIDYPRSMLGRFNIFAHLRLMKHRGITHTLLGMVISSLFVALGGIEASLMFAMGYLSHLVTDGMTPSGVPWLYPFRRITSK